MIISLNCLKCRTYPLLIIISAPKAPKDVKFTVLSPVLARVEWTPEHGLWYELHWRTDDTPSQPHKFKGI